MKIRTLSIVMLLLAAAVQLGWAGAGNRVGTGGASELLIPVGARDLGMGGSTIASVSGIDALFWNPAGIARARYGTNVMFSHMSYIDDIGVSYGAATIGVEGLGTIGVSVKSLAIGDIPVTTEEYTDGTGQTYSPQYFIAGLSYAKQLSDRIAVGVTGQFIAERLSQVSSNGVAFNMGVAYDRLAGLPGLALGVVVKNIGPQMSFGGPGLYQQANAPDLSRGTQYYVVDAAPFDLPSTIEIGLSYQVPMAGEGNRLTVAGAFQNNNYSTDEYKLGAEYAYNNMFFVRGGWDFSPQADNNTYIFGPTLGAGVQIRSEDVDVGFDYAFRHTEYFAGNHVVTLKLGF